MGNRINFIWFDLGYTLLKLHREEVFLELMEDMNIKLHYEEVERAFHLTDKIFMREYRGVLSGKKDHYMPWYLGILLYTLKLRIDICPFYNLWRKAIKSPLDAWVPCPNTIGTLKTLKEHGYRLGVISNWDSTARPILDKHDLTNFFQTIIISSEVGLEKPDKAIFIKALEEADTTPEESIYVGDNYYDDALGSRKAGITAVILNRFGKLGIEEIKDCPVINNISLLEDYINKKLNTKA